MRQCFWVTGNIQNIVEALNQAASAVIQTGARRVYQHRAEVIVSEIEMREATKRSVSA